jgi:hypothetical protein
MVHECNLRGFQSWSQEVFELGQRGAPSMRPSSVDGPVTPSSRSRDMKVVVFQRRVHMTGGRRHLQTKACDPRDIDLRLGVPFEKTPRLAGAAASRFGNNGRQVASKPRRATVPSGAPEPRWCARLIRFGTWLHRLPDVVRARRCQPWPRPRSQPSTTGRGRRYSLVGGASPRSTARAFSVEPVGRLEEGRYGFLLR